MLGVLYLVLNILREQLLQYITAWAIELLILSKAMREPGWDYDYNHNLSDFGCKGTK